MDQWLKVGQITTSYNATNALTVSTPISVSGTAPRSLTYRFEWLDANGASILTTASRDFRTFVQPGAVETLRSVGPADSAVDFRLHLRSP